MTESIKQSNAPVKRRQRAILSALLSDHRFSGDGQAQEGGEGIGHAKEADRDPASSGGTGIAFQSLCPGEAIMSTLCTRQDDRLLFLRRRADLGKHHFDSLVTEQLHAGAPVHSPAPIPPEQRSGTNDERMQVHTDRARLCRRIASPLTLVA